MALRLVSSDASLSILESGFGKRSDSDSDMILEDPFE